MGNIKGIHHVALKCCGVEEFEKTVGFYRDVLGLTVKRVWGAGTEAGAMLDTGSGLMEIFANGVKRLPQGAIRHLAFAGFCVDSLAGSSSGCGV